MKKAQCRHCKREGIPIIHKSSRGEVPICPKCGACMCQDCAIPLED